MNRLFWRFAALVLLAIALGSAVIYFTFGRLFGDPLEHIARDQAAGQIFLLQQYVDQAPADEWLPRLNKVREVSDVTLELQPLSAALSALPAARRAPLLHGEVVMDVGAKAFYRRVDATGARYAGSENDVIHAQNLPIDIGQALRMEAIRFAVIALCLLLPLGWWTRAHGRSLAALSRMADDFGQGNLAARAHVGAGSSVAPLAGRINGMAERIGSLLEARKHLLLSVSHELRTPIARLEFGLELLAERHAAGPDMRRRTDAMAADVEELKALVNEMLELMRIDHAHALPRQPFALAPLLRGCAAAVARPSVRVGVADDLGDARGDPRLLARAVGNLLGNAAKYAVARIALSAVRDGDMLRIVVEDDGPGIPVGQRAQVFEPFYRLSREQDHAAAGHGLGLAIVARAVALHGGSIAIDDSPLGGARFTIHIRA
ncbi:ATP-binding protein [Janthinobacterium sp. JC611]|uniref:ATP-binding protein n=1 Tax=Janthinobacterium sp. JC611 TaxID=2816201 RepID=UPI001BFDE70E|nr:ATP-binding protein [Janthinobacterium sp. JC611]